MYYYTIKPNQCDPSYRTCSAFKTYAMDQALFSCLFWHLIQVRFVSVIQTNLSSSLQLIIRSKISPLKTAHSLGFLIRQLISSFARFAVVNSSCLLYKEREDRSHLATLSASRTPVKLSGSVQHLRTMIMPVYSNYIRTKTRNLY